MPGTYVIVNTEIAGGLLKNFAEDSLNPHG